MNEIKEGQIWRDCDKRTNRFIKVLRIHHPLSPGGESFALVVKCASDGLELGRRLTRINLKRMKPGATGYELVRP